MGDPKKSRKKYSTPRHPWEKTRIDEESALKKEYGFVNKKELWRVSTVLKNFFNRAKVYSAKETSQNSLEMKQLLQRLKDLNLIKGEGSLDAVLSIQLKDVLERRLQTLVFKKKMANTIMQARQFIVHGHIRIGDKAITSPSYLVTLKEEEQLNYMENSALANESHPERAGSKKEEGEA